MKTQQFTLLPVLLASWCAVACGGSQEPAETAAVPPAEPPTSAEVAATKAPATEPESAKPADTKPADTKPADAKPGEVKVAEGPKPLWTVSEGIATPESVFYDSAADRYLVSNINGKPNEVDNNGYIAELSPEGKVTKAKFIAGGSGDVKLDAPKGLVLSGGLLYVSDITTVRKFDAKTGAAKGEVAIPGSTFLNDVFAAPDGRIFVTDSGVKPGAKGFESTGTDAVYVIEKGKVKTLAKGKDLNAPNGIILGKDGPLVNTLTSNELYRLDAKGAKVDVTKLPQGGLDGLVAVGDSLLVSSWQASAVYKGKLNDKFEVVISNVSGPADIGYDTKRNRVLVPRFMDNKVEAYEIK